jgi:cell fate regulator YaaT (PSP1 superfamily)
MAPPLYFLSYGVKGDLDRFEAPPELLFRRRQRVVARSVRGLEIGTVLGNADSAAPDLLLARLGGQILRPATSEDERLAARLRERAGQIFEDARLQAERLGLPIEIFDLEVLLDAKQAVLHYVAWARCDPRGLMDALSDQHRLLVSLHDLAPKPIAGSCGSGGCGSGGCGSCGPGGCGSCGTEHPAEAKLPRVSLV